MTPTNDAPVTVEQCDRDAAASYALVYAGAGLDVDYILEGRSDNSPLVQAFARHRLAAPASAPAGDGVFQMGDAVEKISGSSWRGKVVGFYSTSLTPEGYAVESETETGSVQIYPAKALRLARPRAAVGEEEAEAVAARVYRGYPFPRDEDISPSVMIDFAARAILALQSPPAKVER